jgi:ATP-binding protein involved in chromosome partitioning
MSHYTCTSCSTPHALFGSPAAFERAAGDMGLGVLGRLPLVPDVSAGGDGGRPVMIMAGAGAPTAQVTDAEGREVAGGAGGASGADEVRETMRRVGEGVWGWLGGRARSGAGVRG